MTIDRARELLAVQAGFGGFYNCNAAKLILAEVSREHGQAAVDRLIVELDLERIFGFRLGTAFKGSLAMKDRFTRSG
ncbi:MAG TPA: hypothetical protein DHV08_13870 [Rhodocyclaceae bacterium]|nr:MAG: hypothetical protein AUK49_11000 [Betaproteobacteria bacterium CG2_30_68_42]PIV73701.1 MAG: hypothetical protein COW56_06265 [Rhodocyclales bacterium CG17_big_fil_post_rev_8_21_14_2_50_68_7]PIX73857.1 MAG: hypothetical protein COZ38_12410 [Rhodocyclales bacterium CG_4_10_14_3_um_filter_68_10]PJA58155.1 MAG: hypothetical protein CO164_03975 [Rhodocyclales bacterium CG_4_9_14_3_um_filter_68_10]HCX34516.1 hypothetical protein [Rhodocyclaceae bacterium]